MAIPSDRAASKFHSTAEKSSIHSWTVGLKVDIQDTSKSDGFSLSLFLSFRRFSWLYFLSFTVFVSVAVSFAFFFFLLHFPLFYCHLFSSLLLCSVFCSSLIFFSIRFISFSPFPFLLILSYPAHHSNLFLSLFLNISGYMVCIINHYWPGLPRDFPTLA